MKQLRFMRLIAVFVMAVVTAWGGAFYVQASPSTPPDSGGSFAYERHQESRKSADSVGGLVSAWGQRLAEGVKDSSGILRFGESRSDWGRLERSCGPCKLRMPVHPEGKSIPCSGGWQPEWSFAPGVFTCGQSLYSVLYPLVQSRCDFYSSNAYRRMEVLVPLFRYCSQHSYITVGKEVCYV